jgi:hypothetical protein
MAYNAKRTTRMQQRSVADLVRFYESKTLSSAAAAYELVRRGVALPIRK